jgi:peptidoglycan/LPS O-acetylase OafA/YrhL
MTLGVTVIHLLMRFGTQSNAMVLIAFAAAVAVSILTADLLNRFVEAPAMRLSKHFSIAIQRRPAELVRACTDLAGIMRMPTRTAAES